MSLLKIIMVINMNKKVITLTVAIIVGMIIIPTIYKIHTNHNEKLLLVVEKEFSYYAKQCYLNDECESTVTLKELYDLGYLEEKLTNPINKKYYDASSSINLDTMELNLIS